MALTEFTFRFGITSGTRTNSSSQAVVRQPQVSNRISSQVIVQLLMWLLYMITMSTSFFLPPHQIDGSPSDYDSFMPNAVSQAQAAGKKLIVEEWGSLYGSGRTANLNSNVQKINNYKVPWLYWELISNPDPHEDQDYEVCVSYRLQESLTLGLDSSKRTRLEHIILCIGEYCWY